MTHVTLTLCTEEDIKQRRSIECLYAPPLYFGILGKPSKKKKCNIFYIGGGSGLVFVTLFYFFQKNEIFTLNCPI